MTNSLNPIGIFDSGVGGLTVVKAVMDALPAENIIYFGDTARVPYGTKSKETVTKFSEQNIRFLLTKNVKAVIIACNTVSSNSYNELRERFDLPLIEVVTPGVEYCLSQIREKRVGVIGTEATIRSAAYERAIRERDGGVKVFSKACPLFVPLAEEGWVNNNVALAAAGIYLAEFVENGVDALILGCTHYPLLTDCIKRITGGIKIIDPAKAVAERVKETLAAAGLLNGGENPPSREFYVSDNTQKFERISLAVLGRPYEAVKVDIERY